MKGLVKIFCLLLLSFSPNAYSTTIYYEATDLVDIVAGEDLWNYRYEVHDLPIEAYGFDIFFPVNLGFQFGDLDNNSVASNPNWDALVIQPDPLLPDDGRLDVVSLVMPTVLPDTFSIDFIWRGIAGVPASQKFEVFDANFDVIATAGGRTIPFGSTNVPEPGMLWLMLAGFLTWRWIRPLPCKR